MDSPRRSALAEEGKTPAPAHAEQPDTTPMIDASAGALTKHVFYFCVHSEAEKRLTETDLDVVREPRLPQGDLEDPDYRTALLGEYNKLLPEVLAARGLRRFIPSAPPSFDEKDGVVSVCYHHNGPSHAIVYSAYEEGYIMRPNVIVMEEFEALYEMYDLEGWDDPRVVEPAKT